MIKKVLATVLALSMFSVSASTLPAEAKLESFKSVEQLTKQLSDKYEKKGLDGIRQELIESGVNIKALEKSISELNLDPTLTDAELVATITDFTRSQLESGAAYESGGVYEASVLVMVVFIGLGIVAYYNDSISHWAEFLTIGVVAGVTAAACEISC